ncbi:hypothetical protein KIV45_20940 [Janthinobacterium lividum]|nr:hypothetical protein KIV45_20940 [Janthinobacterium lividum]
MAVADPADRQWLIARVGYFAGEVLVQQYGGCWYVNEVVGSRYFAHYVVGKFVGIDNATMMVDPFELAQVYVDTPAPRALIPLLAEVRAAVEA